MDRIWDVDGIEWGDIPTVHDLLSLADEKILAREFVAARVEEYEEADPEPNKKSIKHARKRVRKFIEELRALEPSSDADLILFPERVCASLDGSWGRRCKIKCTAFERAKLSELAELSMQDDRFSRLAAGVSILEQSWAEILGYKVWLGGDWCRRERYLFLADVLSELSFFGLVQEEHDRAVEAQIRELEESSRSLNNPEGYIAYPAAVCFGARGFASSEIYGLESSSDDYAEAYEDALRRADRRIGSLFEEEMLDNIKALCQRLDRGYWHKPLNAENRSEG